MSQEMARLLLVTIVAAGYAFVAAELWESAAWQETRWARTWPRLPAIAGVIVVLAGLVWKAL